MAQILPVNMTNPRKLGQIAQIFAEGQLRNQELQMNLLRQKKEAQDIQSVAKLYQDETAQAKDPQSVMNAFGKTAFGLMKFGQKAQPILNWLEKDASLRMKALEPKVEKPVNPETFKTGVRKNEGDQVLEQIAERDPITLKLIPGTERFTFAGYVPGASTKATTQVKKKEDLQAAQNLVASLEADTAFMESYNTFAKSGKMQRIMAGDLSGLDEIPLETRQKTVQYLTAKKVVAENTPSVKAKPPKSKKMTKQQMIADFEKEEKRKPTENDLLFLKQQGLWE